MNELLPCRWRETQGDGTLRCWSDKYIGPPNQVNPDLCRSCIYIDAGQAVTMRLAERAATTVRIFRPDARSVNESGIAVVTLYTPEIAEMGKLASQAIRAYAKRHGYTAVIGEASLDPSRRPHWSKLILIVNYLRENATCRWLMWIDADAVITRPEKALESFLDNDVDFVVAEDIPPSPVNTGVFFVRNCPAIRDLLGRAYAKVNLISRRWGEQPALAEALRESAASLRIKVVPRQLFNSFAGSYKEGDFVIHFAGCSLERKLQGVRKAVQTSYGLPASTVCSSRRRHPEADVPMHSYRDHYQRLLASLRPHRVVEWGPGLNTELALGAGAEVFSIEHERSWLPKAAQRGLAILYAAKDSGAYTVFPVDAEVFFIDGRNRSRCLEAVFDRCLPNAVVCLHDSQRQAYRAALSRFPHVLEPSLGFAVATKDAMQATRIASILAAKSDHA